MIIIKSGKIVGFLILYDQEKEEETKCLLH